MQSQNETCYYATFKPINILNGPTHQNKGLTSIGISEFNLLTTSMPTLTDVTWEGATKLARTHCLIAIGLLIVGSLIFRLHWLLYSLAVSTQNFCGVMQLPVWLLLILNVVKEQVSGFGNVRYVDQTFRQWSSRSNKVNIKAIILRKSYVNSKYFRQMFLTIHYKRGCTCFVHCALID